MKYFSKIERLIADYEASGWGLLDDVWNTGFHSLHFVTRSILRDVRN